MILNAPALSLLKESSKYGRNNVGIRRLPGQTCSQDVALSSDTSFFVIKYRELMPGNTTLNTLRPRQNGRRFADDTLNRIFVNENVRISIEFSLKFVPKGPMNNIPELVQIMAWRQPGDKPLSEPVLVRSLTHICVTRPQWVNGFFLPALSYTRHRLTALGKKPKRKFGELTVRSQTFLYHEIQIQFKAFWHFDKYHY